MCKKKKKNNRISAHVAEAISRSGGGPAAPRVVFIRFLAIFAADASTTRGFLAFITDSP